MAPRNQGHKIKVLITTDTEEYLQALLSSIINCAENNRAYLFCNAIHSLRHLCNSLTAIKYRSKVCLNKLNTSLSTEEDGN